MSYLREAIAWLLEFFFNITGNHGVAIILLTILIRLVLYPLFLSQTRSMAAMKKLSPKMKELQQKYKDKPQEYQKRVMELYKEHKVNPLGGCLPLLVQLPILWALFQVLREFDFSTGFLWIKDLSSPDPYYILPVLSAVTSYIQMKQTTTDQSQKAMLWIMPIFIGWISISFAAGLVLYWVMSNLFSIGQQWWVMSRALMEMAPEGGKSNEDRGKNGKDR